MTIQATMATPIAQGSAAFAPATVVNPAAFYQNTRRKRLQVQSRKAINGVGGSDTVTLPQTDIVAGLEIRVVGTVTIGGTIGTTTASYNWPFGLVQQLTVAANGVSNLYQTRGQACRAFEMATSPELTDRGVPEYFGGATQYYSGTMALTSDLWGLISGPSYIAPGANVTAIGTYNVDFTFFVPLAADQRTLIGSVYAQSQATNVSVTLQWATQAQLFSAFGASATFAQALNYEVTALTYSIPNVGGQFIIPDLSQLHSVTETQVTGLGSGVNTLTVPGVGAGRLLMRTLTQVYSGSGLGVPLAVTDANFNNFSYRYGGNQIPELLAQGGDMRAKNERETGVDIGGLWGFALWDWASQNALRDLLDEGQFTNLAMLVGLVSAPTNGNAQLTQEVLLNAAVGV